jgi:hypothetical protein
MEKMRTICCRPEQRIALDDYRNANSKNKWILLLGFLVVVTIFPLLLPGDLPYLLLVVMLCLIFGFTWLCSRHTRKRNRKEALLGEPTVSGLLIDNEKVVHEEGGVRMTILLEEIVGITEPAGWVILKRDDGLTVPFPADQLLQHETSLLDEVKNRISLHRGVME